MKTSSFVISLCAFVSLSGTVHAVPSADAVAAQASPVKGSMLVAADGARVAPVYRLGADGSLQIIVEGRMVTVPGATLSTAGGRLTTSLTKREVLALR